MNNKGNLLIFLLLLCVSVLYPVDNLHAQEFIEDVNSLIIEDDNVSSYLEANYENLTELKNNPIDINNATKEQLEKLPFLSDKIIENILYYIYKYGPLKTKNELWMIEDINRQTVYYLNQFIVIKDIDKQDDRLSLKNLLKYGKNELLTRCDIPLYTKKGYLQYNNEEISDNPNCRYIGYKYYNNVRYKFNYNNRVVFGITAENDAGEPFFTGNNKKGYDYYSPYLLITNLKKINKLVIGNFRAHYGYGLVVNTNSYFGKSTLLYSLNDVGRGLNKHSSTDEYNYFTGLGISYNVVKRLNVDLFYSYRKMDGAVDNMFITSIKKDGFHRLKRDFEKKNTFDNKVICSNISYDGKNCKFGITAVYNVFNKLLKTKQTYYNKYYPQGDEFYNIGAYYKLFFNKLILYGETAVDKSGTIASINTVKCNFNNRYELFLMNRYYDAKYQSIYAQSINEGGRVQNESAFSIGLNVNVLPRISISGYFDYFYFPWKKYLVSKHSTKGIDGSLLLSYSPSYELNMFIKYRYNEKPKDYTNSDAEKIILPYIRQKLSYQINYNLNDRFMLKTLISGTMNNYQYQPLSTGLLITQSLMFKISSFPLRVDLSGTWFNTDGYESRISFYEKDVLYAYSFPSLFDKGVRAAANICYSPVDNISLYAKYVSTIYSNRKSIGTSLEEIEGNIKSDIHLLLRIKF